MTNNKNKFGMIGMIVMILVVGFMAISCDTGFGMMGEELNLDGVWRNNWAIDNNERHYEWLLTFQDDIAIFEVRWDQDRWIITTFQFHIDGNQITFVPLFIDYYLRSHPMLGRYRERYTINTTFRMENHGNTFHLMSNDGYWEWLVWAFRGRFERVR